jgi:hypothetical protein
MVSRVDTKFPGTKFRTEIHFRISRNFQIITRNFAKDLREFATQYGIFMQRYIKI